MRTTTSGISDQVSAAGVGRGDVRRLNGYVLFDASCSNHGIVFTVSSSAKGRGVERVCGCSEHNEKISALLTRVCTAWGGQSHAWEKSNFGDVTSKLSFFSAPHRELQYTSRNQTGCSHPVNS